MQQFKLATFLDPVEGRDEEFNAWYDKQHIPDALSLPGMKSAQRFETGPRFMGRGAPCRYLVIYTIEALSMEKALEVFTHGTAEFYVSDAADLSSIHSFPLTPLGPMYTSSEEARAGEGGVRAQAAGIMGK